MGPEVAGLMYHEVTDDPTTSGFQRPGALPYTLTRAECEARMMQVHAFAPCADADRPLSRARQDQEDERVA